MHEVRLVGLSADGSRLVVEAPDGEQFALPMDERIHAALRGDRARLGQLQIELDSRLRPREIQARIRAGQSLDDVAQEAGIPVERVVRYAGPVLHEREHIAQEAAKVGVRQDDHGAVTLLGELVESRLAERGVPRDALEWDAWRREDGGWEVRLTYRAAGKERSALWIYDAQRRTVSAVDDEARWLIEDPAQASVTTLRPVPTDEPDDEPGDEPVVEPVAETHEFPTRPQQTTKPPTAKPRTPAKAEPRRKKERASVPSWDEILFGSKKPNDT
jgi:hypothetical protein